MFEKVRSILVDKLNIDEKDINMETTFKKDLDIDSLTLFELVMTFEDQFDVEMDDDIAETINSVGDVVKYLEKNAK